MPVFKTDGYIAAGATGRAKPQTAKLWCTDQVIAAGEWIAMYAGDITSPSGLANGVSGSFRIADASNTDAIYNTVGVAMESVDHSASATAAGYVEVAIQGFVADARVLDAVTAGQDLVIDATGSGATAGYADAVGAEGANTRIIGNAVTAGSPTNLADVIVYLHPMFAGIV